MRIARTILLVLCVAPLLAHAQPTPAGARAEVEAFNRAFGDATRHMDNAAALALWADDGVSLLPSTKPLVGKAAIAKFLDAVTAPLAGATMESFEMQCHDIVVSGDWASEWCSEHQVVKLPGGRPPFDGWGKLLLVLHRSAGGPWLISHEMWNQATAGDFGR